MLAKWTDSSATGGEVYGRAVAVDGDFAFVGERPSSGGTGAVHVFERTAAVWTETQLLVASDAAALDYFGWSVAIDGNRGLVGAWAYNSDQGSAYVFDRSGSTFVESQKLVPVSSSPFGLFGWSVDLDGDRAVVGAYGAGAGAGLVVVFDRGPVSWTQTTVLHALDADAGDNSGYAAAVSGDTAIVGAWHDDDRGAESGSAHVFSIGGAGCPTLVAAPAALSLATGGTQALALVTQNPGQVYFLLGSASGSAPGTPVDGLLLPLNADSYSRFTLLHPNTGLLANALGTLDANGEAQASFDLPAGLDPGLAGLVLHHAYIVIHPADTHAVLASAAVSVELIP